MVTWASHRFFSVCLLLSLFFPVVVKQLLRQASRNLFFVQVYVCAREAVSELHPHQISFGYWHDENAVSRKLISVGPRQGENDHSVQRKPNK